MSLLRWFAIACVIISASAPEMSAQENVPLPRSRPKAAPLAPKITAETREIEFHSSEVVKRWAICKLLVAEGWAWRVELPEQNVMSAASAACAKEEQELRNHLAQGGMRAEAIQELIAELLAKDEALLTNCVRTVRARRAPPQAREGW